MTGQTDISLSDYINRIDGNTQFYLADQIKDNRIEDSADNPLAYLQQQGYQIVQINTSQSLIIPHDLILARPIDTSTLDNNVLTIGQRSNQSTCKITGNITDAKTNEPIIGATVLNEVDGQGTVTDVIGDYQISCPCGLKQSLQIASIGYENNITEFVALSDAELNVNLFQETELIDEVVISGRQSNDNVQSSVTGLSELSMQEIKKLPNLLGEPDILKSLLTLSGVTNAGEGASGVNVRGGNADQNLILLDEMTFFNPTHSFGFFSALHPEMVSGLELYKGVMPSSYGGRLSSVLQTKSTKGSLDKWKAKVGLGLISTKAFVEGPLWKDKTTVSLASRISHINWLISAIDNPSINQSQSNFYDVHGKITHKVFEKMRITVQGYQSSDGFRFSDQFDIDYQTRNGSVELNYFPMDQLSIKLASAAGTYDSDLTSLIGTESPLLSTGINHVKHRGEATYEVGGNWVMKAGVEYTDHTVNPGILSDSDNPEISAAQEQHTRSLSPYASIEGGLWDRINITAGLRNPMYQRLGESSEVIYNGNPVLNQSEGIRVIDAGQEVFSFNQLEPRIGLTINIVPTLSLKASYNRTSQFISQISNTAAPTPIDFWFVSNQYILPQVSDAYSLGLYKNWDEDEYETSVEGYYKEIDNVTETIDFADIIANPFVETQLLQGIGRTYGIEANLTKSSGQFTGKLNYTFSRSLRRVQNDNQGLQINNGDWYSANFDKPHSLNMSMKYEIGKRSAVAMAFTYSTGRPVTAPISVYENFDVEGIYVFSDRNSFRIPDYHRLDIAYDYYPNIKKDRKYKTFWSFGIYNVYGRNNAYSVFFEQRNGAPPRANSLAIIGVPLPSITLNVEF